MILELGRVDGGIRRGFLAVPGKVGYSEQLLLLPHPHS